MRFLLLMGLVARALSCPEATVLVPGLAPQNSTLAAALQVGNGTVLTGFQLRVADRLVALGGSVWSAALSGGRSMNRSGASSLLPGGSYGMRIELAGPGPELIAEREGELAWSTCFAPAPATVPCPPAVGSQSWTPFCDGTAQNATFLVSAEADARLLGLSVGASSTVALSTWRAGAWAQLATAAPTGGVATLQPRPLDLPAWLWLSAAPGGSLVACAEPAAASAGPLTFHGPVMVAVTAQYVAGCPSAPPPPTAQPTGRPSAADGLVAVLATTAFVAQGSEPPATPGLVARWSNRRAATLFVGAAERAGAGAVLATEVLGVQTGAAALDPAGLSWAQSADLALVGAADAWDLRVFAQRGTDPALLAPLVAEALVMGAMAQTAWGAGDGRAVGDARESVPPGAQAMLAVSAVLGTAVVAAVFSK